jgi:hypothetical protein
LKRTVKVIKLSGAFQEDSPTFNSGAYLAVGFGGIKKKDLYNNIFLPAPFAGMCLLFLSLFYLI